MTYPAPGTVGAFTRKPDYSYGIQFDGQITTLVTIFQAAVQTVGAAGVQLVTFFGADNLVDSVTISGGALPQAVGFSRTDWVLLPTAGGVITVLPDADMRGHWDPTADPPPPPAAGTADAAWSAASDLT